MKDKKVLFMGTPEFAVPVLEKLIENCSVVGVVTQPDSYVGRKNILTESPIKILAQKHNIKVYQPKNIKKEKESIISLEKDIIITCAYGQIIPEDILNSAKYKTINVHGSLLPKLRGGAPMERAIMNGDSKTGITIMRTDKGMDSGDIIKMEVVQIEDNDTYETLSNKMKVVGANLLIEVLPSIFNETCNYIKQNSNEVTFAPIISKDDEHISFNNKAKDIYNHIRALSYLGCYAILDDERIKIYEVEIGNDVKELPSKIMSIYKNGIGVSTLDKEIIIKKIQIPGKKIMNVSEYLNGKKKEELINKFFN